MRGMLSASRWFPVLHKAGSAIGQSQAPTQLCERVGSRCFVGRSMGAACVQQG